MFNTKLPDPPPMFQTTYAERRGTLTLTDRGAVLGVPEGTAPVEETRAGDKVTRWLANGATGTLVLPWPVDVDDLRGQMYERVK